MDDQVFVLFGGTGDLAKRKIIPALYNLFIDQKLPARFAILGLSRKPWSREQYQGFSIKSLHEFSRHDIDESDSLLSAFLYHVNYLSFDASVSEHYGILKETVKTIESNYGISQNRTFYLSMAPDLFGLVTESLHRSGLTETKGSKRLIIEKPFGRDLASATSLQDRISSVFREQEVYRIDHYLGKEMVQNIEVLRFANSVFEPLWNNRHIANVQITSTEWVGVEERAAYYDHAGALRDMVQNHMLQMLMMVAMEPPSRLHADAIRDEKVKVLRSLRPLSTVNITRDIVRGQYLRGQCGDREVAGYREEPGVNPASTTETFVAARLSVDNFRWAGVPFYIRTGKRLDEKTAKIVIEFKNVPERLYFNQSGGLQANLLTIQISPTEGVSVRLNEKSPQHEGTIHPISIDFSEDVSRVPEAYERLILDAMRGDSTFFTHWTKLHWLGSGLIQRFDRLPRTILYSPIYPERPAPQKRWT